MSRLTLIAGGGEQQPLRLRVFVPGRPAPQGSKRHVGKGRMIESSPHVARWRQTVAWTVAAAYHGGPVKGPVKVGVEFVLPDQTGRHASSPHVARPDLDKLLRAVLDALTGVLWVDDSQVVEVFARKRWAGRGEQPGAMVAALTPSPDSPERTLP